jgi:hypothetical protein
MMLAFQGVLQHRLGEILGRFGRGGTFEQTDDPYWIKVRYRAYAPEDHWFPVRGSHLREYAALIAVVRARGNPD